MSLMLSLVRLMRPHQWLKNVFVFAGLMFSQSWGDGPLVARILLTFAAFCCVSSAVYILNDWRDRASDALHPTKFKRPLASGAVSLSCIVTTVFILSAVPLAIVSNRSSA